MPTLFSLTDCIKNSILKAKSMLNRNIFSAIFIILSVMGTMSSFGAIREPAVAGKFYPSEPEELKQMVTGHLGKTPSDQGIDGQIIAILVPHAGLVYSGQIAAYAYKLLENSGISKVVLCGPSHQYGFQGISVYGPGIIWKTPLGNQFCDDTLCNWLGSYNKNISVIPEAHAREHCLEVQLPYLQTVLKDFKIVPMIMGHPDKANVDLLTQALSSLPFDKKTFFVSSTDWQHYRPASQGGEMDSLGIDCLRNLDANGLEKYLQEGKVEMCGGAPAVAVIRAAIAKGANKVKILKYGDSGDISGDKSSVVGYVAAVLYKSDAKKETGNPNGESGVLNDADLIKKYDLNDANKTRLLQIARESIKHYMAFKTLPEFDAVENLQKFAAAFVTLEKEGMLRGCIGHTTAEEPLYKTVSICAVQAAFADRRFPPVRPEEIEKLHIEISILSSMQKVGSFEEIRVGKDGLMIFKGNERGLLLPQVAVDYGWNATEFLEQTCEKAGLNPDDYKLPEAIIYKFQAVVFGE